MGGVKGSRGGGCAGFLRGCACRSVLRLAMGASKGSRWPTQQ